MLLAGLPDACHPFPRYQQLWRFKRWSDDFQLWQSRVEGFLRRWSCGMNGKGRSTRLKEQCPQRQMTCQAWVTWEMVWQLTHMPVWSLELPCASWSTACQVGQKHRQHLEIGNKILRLQTSGPRARLPGHWQSLGKLLNHSGPQFIQL